MAMEIKVVFEETAQEMAVGFENSQIIDASEGSLVPEGTLTITENGTYDVAQFATADVDVPVPDGYLKPDGTLVATQEGVYDVAQYASADFSVQKQQASIIPTQETQTITPSEKAFFDKVVVEAIPSEYIVPDGVLDINSNGEYDVTSYAQAVVNTPDMTGTPIEVAELPAPTADTVGKVYKVGEDYYVGEESFVLWANREDIGTDKIYLNTSVDIPEIMKDVPMVDGGASVEVFGLSDGYSGRTFSCNLLDLSAMGMEGYLYLIADTYMTSVIYADCTTLTVEQVNELFSQMELPITITHFGWQMEECVVDTSVGYTQVYLNEYPNGEPFAYKEKGYAFKNLDNPPILQEKTATENGEVVADSGFDGLSKVTIDVQPSLEQTTITANGTFTPSGGYDGFSSVTVDVPTPVFKTQEKTVTENGVVTPDDGYDGLSKVTVEVASTGGGDAQAVIDAFITRSLTEVESDIESIGTYVFYSCTKLTTVNIPNAISIGASAFSACSSLNSVNFPNATSIGASAFDNCQNLQSANMPNVQKIDNYTFRNCRLVSANFPNATSIRMYAFYGNHHLITANFPNVTSLNNFSVYYCSSLTKVIIGIKQTGVATLSNTNAFLNCNHILGIQHSTYNPTGAKDGYIYVPHSLVADYRSATNWATYATQIMPYVATVDELANIDGTTYDKACVGDDYTEYTYNGTGWEVYIR